VNSAHIDTSRYALIWQESPVLRVAFRIDLAKATVPMYARGCHMGAADLSLPGVHLFTRGGWRENVGRAVTGSCRVTVKHLLSSRILHALLENKKVPFLLVFAFCAIAMQRASFDLREYVHYWRIRGALQNGEKGKYVRNIYLRRGITKQVRK